MFFLAEIAERRIEESIANGDADALTLAGQPMNLDVDRNVPSEYRALYRVLKHANIAPAEIQQIRELSELSQHKASVNVDSAQVQQRRARLAALTVAIDLRRRQP